MARHTSAAYLESQRVSEEPESLCLTPRTSGTGWIPTRVVRPLEELKPLFGLFGGLTCAQDVVGFADGFGPLGGAFTRSISFLRTPPAGDAYVTTIGELVDSWLEEARAMRVASQLWTCVKKRDKSSILDVLSAEAKRETDREKAPYSLPDLGSLSYFFPTAPRERAPRTAAEVVEAIRELAQGGDPVPLAMDCIVSTINWRLPLGIGAKLDWSREGTRRPKALMTLIPANLHQAMWLQLATAVRGGMEYEECAWCHLLFDVPIKRVGRPRVYCSDACRMRALRARKAEARQLHDSHE